MIQVVSSSTAPSHLKRLREWFVAEWGEVDSFGSETDGTAVPRPLLALQRDELIGGLAFSGFRQPDSTELGLWINALFVTPKHRRRGIASRLIRAAEAEAVRAGERRLFALTDIPTLYSKLGWHSVKRSSEGTVVAAVLEIR